MTSEQRFYLRSKAQRLLTAAGCCAVNGRRRNRVRIARLEAAARRLLKKAGTPRPEGTGT